MTQKALYHLTRALDTTFDEPASIVFWLTLPFVKQGAVFTLLDREAS